jgi:lambda repressor-like predicted transcriptional regulator
MAIITDWTSAFRRGEATLAASLIGAYLECEPAVQDVIREMVAIINAEDSDPDDIDAALHTLQEALFPALSAEICAADDRMRGSPPFQDAARELDREEQAFADRVRQLMQQLGMTQEQLARETGITQPAVSNILTRAARPQRRTVQRFATALGVAPSDLWPDY